MNKTYTIRQDGTGRFFAVVKQITETGIGLDEIMLNSRWFNTESGAQRWLNKQRED